MKEKVRLCSTLKSNFPLLSDLFLLILFCSKSGNGGLLASIESLEGCWLEPNGWENLDREHERVTSVEPPLRKALKSPAVPVDLLSKPQSKAVVGLGGSQLWM